MTPATPQTPTQRVESMLTDNGIRCSCSEKPVEMLYELATELEAAQRALEEAKRDTARLDWLEKEKKHVIPVCTWGGSSTMPGSLDIPHDGVVWTNNFNDEHPTIRAAIDAARERSGEA